MKKSAYLSHEDAYRSIKERGLTSWDGAADKPEVDPDYKAFIEKALKDFCKVTSGYAIELGCGTGPLLRDLYSRGWQGVGVDISETAVAMAREQSKDTKLTFLTGDITRTDTMNLKKADLVLDGHCLHCLIEDEDRDSFFRNAYKLLHPGGLLILDAMAGPLDRAQAAKENIVLRGNVSFAPLPEAQEVLNAKKIDGIWHQPVRRLEHWQDILRRMRKWGFDPLRFMVTTSNNDEFISDLLAVARKN